MKNFVINNFQKLFGLQIQTIYICQMRYYYRVQGISKKCLYFFDEGNINASSKEKAIEKISKSFVSQNIIPGRDIFISIWQANKYTDEYFHEMQCELCQSTFTMSDKRKDSHNTDMGKRFCSNECKKEMLRLGKSTKLGERNFKGSCQGVIYKITNKKTNMFYVGKTQNNFAYRWYQHFYCSEARALNNAIEKYELSDWLFEVIEIVRVNPALDFTSKKKIISDREKFWIKKLDAINKGYNMR